MKVCYFLVSEVWHTGGIFLERPAYAIFGSTYDKEKAEKHAAQSALETGVRCLVVECPIVFDSQSQHGG